MRALTNNTLIQISKHTNKVLKIATYMAKSEQPMLLNNIYMIDDTTAQKDALVAFQKDFDKTVDLIVKSHQLLSTVREDGIVEQLDNEEKNISVIFEDKYDKERMTLNLSSVSINLNKNLENADVRDSIMKSVLDIDYATFRDFIKNADKIYKLDEGLLETEEDAIEYLSSLAYREKYDVIIDKIKTIAGEFSEYRNDLGLNNRNLIDNEITFSRSMIDSVMKNSTYITKDSIEQVASPHKKNMDLVEKLHEFIVKNNYIHAIEIDPDTNIKAILDILEKTNDLKLNIKNQFTLKCRKLGNYKANGLYLPRMHIAAVDISNPSALIHELTHAADISNPELYNHILREEMINKYKQMIDTNDLSLKGKLGYFLNNEEVIARLGEISYILSKYDYKGEEISEFIGKVREAEVEFNSDYLNIAKPIDTYLSRSNIYFNFEKMNPTDLLEVKDYFKSYFGVNNDDIKPVYSNFINYEKKPSVKAKRVVNQFKDSPYVKLDSTSVSKALDYNYKNKIIPFNQLFMAIAENIDMIARRKKTLTLSDLDLQLKTTNKIYEWVANNNDLDVKAELVKSFYILGKGASSFQYIPLKLAFKLSNSVEEMDKVNSVINACHKTKYIKSGLPLNSFRNSHHNGLSKVLKTISFDDLMKRMEISDPITHTFIFSDKSIELFSKLSDTKWAENGEKILSTYNTEENRELFQFIRESNMSNGYIKLNEEQSNYVIDNKVKAFGSGVRVVKIEGVDTITFSTSPAQFYMQANLVKIRNTDKFEHLFKDNLLEVDFSAIKTGALLGTEKVVSENFKDSRRDILEKSLEELKNKQAEEAVLIDKEKVKTIVKKTAVTDIIHKKENEQKEKEKIEQEDKKVHVPIVSSKANQLKLF